MKFVFLYTEIAGYFLACVKKLVELHNTEVHIFRYPVNSEAPFEFPLLKNVFYYERKNFTRKKLKEKVSEINPDCIYCAGWIDKDYLETVKIFSGKIPAILGFDNKWKNSVRQKVAALIAPFYLTNNFSHCFIPGEKQKQFSLKLGFKNNQILTGLYSADFDLFHSYYKLFSEEKKKFFPKIFLYAARYVKHKGIEDLWTAFIQLQNEFPNDWELWCIGTGDVQPIQHPKIKHFGFVQPEQLGKFIRQTGVYILPSRFEPWGVSLHEFAAAGFPLICSNEVGASEKFLENEKNGFLFNAGNIQELKNCMKKIILLNEQELKKMSELSIEKAKQITPETWANAIFQILT